jgi:PAS domain S-box-containing protein
MDEQLMRLARAATSDLATLLAEASAVLRLDDARVVPPLSAEPYLAALHIRRIGVESNGGGSTARAGIWRGDTLAGVLECIRHSVATWSDADRAGVVALADRIAMMLEREESERALRASEEAYRTIFDSSNDAIFVHDIGTGAVIDANRTACEVNGVTLEQLRTRGIDLIGQGPPPFTRELALEYLGRAAAGEPQRFEWCTYHWSTGEEAWVEVGLQRVTIRGEDRLLALVRDIRERKRAERALIESEEAYRTIFQHSSEAIWVHDSETGALLDVNDAGCEMYGYTRDEMMTIGHGALLYPGSVEYSPARQAEYMGRALAGESPRFEWMGRHRDGSSTWGEVTLRLVTVSGRKLLLATARDIRERKEAEAALHRANEALEQRVINRTAELAAANAALEEEIAERRRAEDALRRSEVHFRRMIEGSSDLVMIVDPTGAITYVGPSCERLLGWTPDQMHGTRPPDLVHPEDVPYVMGELHDILAHPGRVQTTQFRMRHADGSWRVFENVGKTLSPVSAAEGIVANGRDITERCAPRRRCVMRRPRRSRRTGPRASSSRA